MIWDKALPSTSYAPSLSVATLAKMGTSSVCQTSSAPITWVVDSGSSDHMIGD